MRGTKDSTGALFGSRFGCDTMGMMRSGGKETRQFNRGGGGWGDFLGTCLIGRFWLNGLGEIEKRLNNTTTEKREGGGRGLKNPCPAAAEGEGKEGSRREQTAEPGKSPKIGTNREKADVGLNKLLLWRHNGREGQGDKKIDPI